MSKHSKKSEVQAQVDAVAETVKVYRMREHLSKYKPRYIAITSGSGNSSLCNGDDVAQRLAGKTPIEVLELAERLLGIELKSKYANLNPGQVRMNCGNRIRSAVKKGAVALDLVK